MNNLIGPDRRILHQEIAAIISCDLDGANLHERAFDGFVFFIQYQPCKGRLAGREDLHSDCYAA